MQKILVTGAGGFLGKYLIDALLIKEEYIVYAFDLTKDIIAERFPENESIRFFDSADWEDGKIPFENVDIVVHCAFSRTNTGPDLAKSLIFTQRLFLESFDNNCHLINISSRSVYGQNPNIPWDENTRPEPDNLYALAKFSSELLIKTAKCVQDDTYFTNIRLAGLVGPELEARIVNKFINNAIHGEPIIIKGGKQQFAYLDVRDAAYGIIALLHIEPKAWQPVYNLGYHRSHTIIEIAETVASVARKFNCPEVKNIIDRTDETLYAEIDSTLFYKDTNWQPQYDMEAIIESIFVDKVQKQSK